MDTLVRDGKPQTWLAAGTFINTDRTITSVAGNRITLDVPLSDSLDAAHLTPSRASLVIQQPPGAKNWCIGCTGRPATILWHGGPIAAPEIPSDTFESPGVAVSPASLYLAQLRDRLGASALEAIGYADVR
jgi:hypothetical protein